MKKEEKIKIIDLFSGVGGLSYGFETQDDFEIVAANEILPNMARAYKLNFPKTKMFCKDISMFGIKDLEDLSVKRGEIDIVLGGPPCQAYSTIGKRLLEDPRANLYRQYHRVLRDIKPKVFIYENVVGLSSMQDGKLIKEIIENFESCNYRTYIQILNAADYGVPQNRKRIFIIGTTLPNEYKFPKPICVKGASNLVGTKMPDSNSISYLTVGDALGDLPSLSPGESKAGYKGTPTNAYQREMRKYEDQDNSEKELSEHICPKYNEKLIDLMSMIKEGESAWDLEDIYHPSSGFGNTYARLWWDRPSTTVTRNFGAPSSSRCIHPKENRALTTREGARLQSFPDNFKFYGSRSEKNLQIGNAVPPIVASHLARSIKEHING
jgi:DNA (cytosine-5)-methyltransferase 1